MSAVAPIYDAWGNRASAKEPDAIVNGERLFKVGGYTITVPDNHDEPAKVASTYNKWGASENPMPNLSFSDGEMRIPVEDFVDLILRRVPADELAEGLWRDESVRERFVYCMAERYSGAGIEDADRRSLLNQIQVAIHAQAIDRAVERLNRYEEGLRSQTNHYRWRKAEHGIYDQLFERYKVTLFEMREKGLLDDEQVEVRLKPVYTPERLREFESESSDPVMRESVGPEWQASRDYWRARLLEYFPEPTSAMSAEGQDPQGLGAKPASATGAAGDAQPSSPSNPGAEA
jgi:hypothetical protein